MSNNDIKLFRSGMVQYIEPNNIEINGKSIQDEVSFRNDPEDLNILVDLYVEKSDIYDCAVKSNSSGSEGQISGVQDKEYIHFLGGTDGNLSTNYTNITLSDVVCGDQREMIGVSNISINYDSWFVPTVNVTFVDVRGASLMLPQEASYYSQLAKERQESEDYQATHNGETKRMAADLTKMGTGEYKGSFFKSLFAFPPPVFYLSVKGFYGKPVTYKLALQNISLELDSSTGNFNANCKFIGYLYGLFTDLPAVYCSIAPYINYRRSKSGENSEESNWKVRDYKFPSHFGGEQQSVPMFADFTTILSKILTGDNGDFYEKNDIEAINTLEKSCNALTSLNLYFPFTINKNDNSKWECINMKNGSVVYYYIATDENVDNVKKVIKELGTQFVNTMNNLPLKDDITRVNKLIGGDKYISNGTFNNDSIYDVHVSNKTANVTKNKCANGSLPYCYDILKERFNTAKNGKLYVFEYVFDSEIEKTISSWSEDYSAKCDKKYEEIYNKRNSEVQAKYGFLPCIEDMFHLIFCHMNCFMGSYFDCLDDVSNQLKNGERTLENFGLSSLNTDLNTSKFNNGEKNTQLPPFPLVMKDKIEGGVTKRVEIWPPSYDRRLENLPEVQLVYAMLNAAREFNSATDKNNKALENTNSSNTDGGSNGTSSGEPGGNGTNSEISCNFLPINQADLFSNKNPYVEIFNMYSDNSKSLMNFLALTFAMRYTYSYLTSCGFQNCKVSPTEASKYIGYAEAINMIVAAKACNSLSKLKNWFIYDRNMTSMQKSLSSYLNKGKILKGISNGIFFSGIMDKTKYYFLSNKDKKVALPIYSFTGKFMTEVHETNGNKAYYINPEKEEWEMSNSSDNYHISNYTNMRNLFNSGGITNPNNDNQVNLGDILPKTIDNSTDEIFNSFFKAGAKEDFCMKKLIEKYGKNYFTTNNFDISLYFSKAHFNTITTNIFFTNVYYIQKNLCSKAYLFLMSFNINNKRDDFLGSCLNGISNQMANGYRTYIEILIEGAFAWRYHKMTRGDKKDPIILPSGSTWSVPDKEALYKCDSRGGIVFDASKLFPYIKAGKDRFKNQYDICEKMFINFANGEFQKINDTFSLRRKLNGKELSKMIGYSFTEENIKYINTNNDLYDLSDISFDTNGLHKDGLFKYYKGIKWGKNSTNAKNLILSLMSKLYLCIDIERGLSYCNKPGFTSVNFRGASIDTSLLDCSFDSLVIYLKSLNEENNDDSKKTDGSDTTVPRKQEPESQIVAKTDIIKTEEDSTQSNDMRLATYLTLKNMYDKWIAGTNREDWEFSNSKNVFSKFVYIDNFYREMGDKLMVNLNELGNSINRICASSDGNHIESLSVYTLLSDIANKNNCMIFALPQMFGIQAYNKNGERDNTDDGFTEMFSAKTYKDAINDLTEQTSFVVMYNYNTSKHLDNPEEPWKCDGFDLADTLGNTNPLTPTPLTEQDPENQPKKVKYIPAFGVSYGQQNQSFFKDITLSTNNPSVTEYSIASNLNIASTAGQSSKAGNAYGQDLYRTFSNYAYSCEVTMMGNAMVTPLMYFQLNNIPLWKGAYIITKVSHSISPGKMETKFTGTRLSKYATNFVEPGILQIKDFVKKIRENNGQANYEPSEYTSGVDQALYATGFTISQTCANRIKKQEGLILTCTKQDTNGKWTIGYGHSQDDVYKGMTISKASADTIFDHDVSKFCISVEKQFKKDFKGDMVSLSKASTYPQGCMDAIIDMAYNGGLGGLKGTKFYNKLLSLKPSDLDSNGRIKKDVYLNMVDLIPQSLIYANGKKLEALVKRRNEEVEWCKKIYNK